MSAVPIILLYRLKDEVAKTHYKINKDPGALNYKSLPNRINMHKL